MTGLQSYDRDLEMSMRLGDRQLRLPDPEEFLSLVRQHMWLGDAAPLEAELLFARWKPATAVLGSWEVGLDDGSRRRVSYKVYAGAKSDHVRHSFTVKPRVERAARPLRPVAFLPDTSAFLTVFPADRVLRGASRAIDLRRTGRALDRAGLWEPRVMRRRSSHLELLRYKPERRAVLRLDAKLKLRDPGGNTHPDGEHRLALRVVDPRRVEALVNNRRACRFEKSPRLVHVEAETGLLAEEWLEGSSLARDDFGAAAECGALLAELHEQSWSGPQRGLDRSADVLLLERLAGARGALGDLPARPDITPRCWVHGDFHPDQHLRGQDGLHLMDLDELRPGAPEEDLASWIADHLAARPELDLADAAAPLLEGYGSRAAGLDRRLLLSLVVDELVRRAAAGLRRLQVDAESRALSLIDRARRASQEVLS